MTRWWFLILLMSCNIVWGNNKAGRLYSFKKEIDVNLVSKLFNQADSLAKSLPFEFEHYQIFKTEEERILFLFDGMNYVFEWKSDTITELSKEIFHGFNYTSFKFERDHQIYTYGGNGFWSFSSDIKVFDERDGLWHPIPAKGEKPFFDGGRQLFSFYADDKLYVYFHSYSPLDRYRFPVEIKKNRLYIFDFKDGKWESYSFFDEILPLRRQMMIETKRFFNFYHEGYLSFLIDKENLTYYSFPRDMRDFGFFEEIFYEKYNLAVIGDSVLLFSKPPESKLVNVYDFNQIAETTDLSLFQVKNFNQNSHREIRVFLGLFILFAFIVILNGIKKIRALKRFPYSGLLSHIDEEIDQNVLDERLFMSLQDQTGSLKNKRSEIIQEINFKYHRLIEIQRLKSLDDKRVYRYKVVIKMGKLYQWYMTKFVIPKIAPDY